MNWYFEFINNELKYWNDKKKRFWLYKYWFSLRVNIFWYVIKDFSNNILKILRIFYTNIAIKYLNLQFTYKNLFYFGDTDSKYLVLPSGELHIKDVGPEDGYKSYQCRTKHRLTGETRLSATKGRLVITGECFLKKFLL